MKAIFKPFINPKCSRDLIQKTVAKQRTAAEGMVKLQVAGFRKRKTIIGYADSDMLGKYQIMKMKSSLLAAVEKSGRKLR